MFGYYIRAQNAGILICTDASNKTILSTFPASLKSDVIMSTCHGEVVTAYPEQSIIIPNSDILSSLALARQIITLTNETLPYAMGTSKKAGTEIVEVREVCDTKYVSGWLTALLSDANSSITSNKEFPRICKKVRDTVSWNNSFIPWRRSGMWMNAKVILQLSLVKNASSREQGTFLYKTIIAEFMRQICELTNNLGFDADIGIHMMKKLARRVKKIQVLNTQIPTFTTKILQETSMTCKQFKLQLLKLKIVNTLKVILEEIKIDKDDTIHKTLPKIPVVPVSTGLLNFHEPLTFPPRVDLTSVHIPRIKPILGASEENRGFYLYDVESWIFNHIDRYAIHSKFVLELRTLALDYSSLAPEHYKTNPVGASRMILAFLKIVQVLHQIAVKNFSMLMEHRSGIDTKIFEQLLLPLKNDMEIAYSLECYFN